MHIDLVLADLNMPVMDGVEMIVAMHDNSSLRRIPVIVITARPDARQIEQLQSRGVIGYLAKPFTPESISCLIAPLLDSTGQISLAVPKDSEELLDLSLTEALVEALETMAFISPESAEKLDLPGTTAELRVVHIEFHGQGVDGSLAIAAPPSFCQVVADNCTASDRARECDDALKELANVTCGLWLRKRSGGGAGFKMALPVIGPNDEMKHWIAGGDAVVVSADGYMLAAHSTMHATLPAAEGVN
jgi:CheY-like chemotaxis protein